MAVNDSRFDSMLQLISLSWSLSGQESNWSTQLSPFLASSTPPLTPQTMRQLWCTNCRKWYWWKQDPSSESWTSPPNWTGGLQEASFADDVALNSANHKYEWKLSCYFSFPTVCSLLSLALFAKEHNCVKPELTDSSVIYIKAGRWRVHYSLCC